ncbi:MAG: hypothetical protein R3324_01205 [Halobacteriales archaeon]|nr:hypothetical protein [Halobacteriales archaeon]
MRRLQPIRSESGVALPVALLGIILIGALAAGVWMSVAIGARSGENRTVSAAGVQIAEAGVAHAILVLREDLVDEEFTEILRGSDATWGTSDDGILTGWGLSSEMEIPASGRSLGGGTYTVHVVDDPAELDGDPSTDTNFRVLLEVTGTAPDGGEASIDVVINDGTAAFVPSFVLEGDLYVDGNPSLIGSCGGVHSNNNVDVGGDLTVTQTVAAVDTVTVSGSITDLDGDPVTPQVKQPPVSIPDYSNPVDEFCVAGEYDYVLRSDGYVEEVATGSLYDARSSKVFGWERTGDSPTHWKLDGNSTNAGTYCAYGNVEIAGNPDAGGGPLSLSVIASKSIDVSGNPQIAADHPDGVLLVAGSDVRISGNLSGDPGDYSGLIYARAQCDLRGNANISSRVLCRDANNASGAHNLVDQNGLGGNVVLDYACSATTGVKGPRQAMSWAQQLGG